MKEKKIQAVLNDLLRGQINKSQAVKELLKLDNVVNFERKKEVLEDV